MSYKTEASYRPDIDGLRAFAVLSVVLFHAFPDVIPAGFTGVDVFFVISGFLITGILWRELQTPHFSLRLFYARRVRRIFPVLILVLLASLGFGWWVLFADEYKQLGNHTLRAGLFLSNFALWRESGYFDAQAELKPLLHLWSLAIEEQFYILWPGVLWLLHRRSRRPLFWIFALLMTSMVWNLYQSQRDPTHDFYSPLTRFWELMAGGLLAVAWPRLQHRLSPSHKRMAGLLAVALLLAGLVLPHEAKVYPSGWALLPVLGACLVILSEGSFTPLQRALTHPLSLWIGEISYALYLWHWPLLSFARIIEGETPHLGLRVALVVVAFLLAAASARYVERFYRHGPVRRGRIAFLCGAMVFTATMGYMVNRADGYDQRRLTGEAFIAHAGSIGHDEFHQLVSHRYYPCADSKVLADAGDWMGLKRCFQSKPDGPIDLLLLGDSHAEHLFPGFAQALPDLNVVFYGKAGLPLHDNPNYAVIFDTILNTPEPYPVLISAMWHARVKEVGAQSKLSVKLSETLQRLEAAGKPVYWVDDVYQFQFDPQRCKYLRPLSGSATCSAPRALYESQFAKYLPELQAVAQQHPKATFLTVKDALCDAQSCSMLHAQRMAYRDNNHLNLEGSTAVVQTLLVQAPQLRSLSAKP